MTSLTVHASCVAFGNKAVLIRGKPGSGKSDLVLQLIDAQGYGLGAKLLRAKLVADDVPTVAAGQPPRGPFSRRQRQKPSRSEANSVLEDL